MFNFDKFLSSIHEHFKNDALEEDVYKVLDLKEEYGKDSPHSIGKRLKLCRVKIKGEKGQDKPINYDKKIYDGINVWVADNSMGKSSIFKVIKFALTGNNDLKEDVKGWIREIYLEFDLGNKYCIFITNQKSSRIKGGMYKLSLDEKCLKYNKTLIRL